MLTASRQGDMNLFFVLLAGFCLLSVRASSTTNGLASTTTAPKSTSAATTTNGANDASSTTTTNGANDASTTTTANGANAASTTTTANGANAASTTTTVNGANAASTTTTANGANAASTTTTANGANAASTTTTANGANAASTTTSAKGANAASTTTSANGGNAASTTTSANGANAASTTSTANDASATTTTANLTAVSHENGCSFHQKFSCHERATCIDIDKETNKWECQCDDDLKGDGLKGENNTGCEGCNLHSDCFPTLATCTSENKCKCIPGYHGDGKINCTDVNECHTSPCHKYAYCNNTVGSYLCTCDERNGYKGNGSHCIHFCTMDIDCDANQMCVGQECDCKSGYYKNETILEKGCTDINECETVKPCDGNATCTNTDGGYICECINGYRGNGETCYEMPMNCHDIHQATPGAASGKYDIDPDFTGPLEITEVDCEMRQNFGITIMKTTTTKKFRIRPGHTEYGVEYELSVQEIKAVINSSEFCYQSMTYECRYGATLMNGDDYLVDGDGNRVYSFGGSKVDDKCLCGEMNYCRNRSNSCNCDGNMEYGIDEGKELNKNRLPYTKLVSEPNRGRVDVLMGEVRCAPKPHDFPKDCHDAKFTYKAKRNSAWHVDVDGEDGELDPILVYCDVESEKHVGITHVPTSVLEPTEMTQPGNVTVTYAVTDAHLDRLIADSDSCQQELRYSCQNSRMLNNGDKMTYFWDTRGEAKDHWPYGSEPFKCGCGMLENCADKSYGCNCDANDGELRTDYGQVTAKDDLPVGRVTALDVGGTGQFGEYFVGDLKCSQKQFGIKPLCQDIVVGGEYNSQALVIDPDGPPSSLVDTENEDPFIAYCEMTKEPPTGATIIFHDQELIHTSSPGSWNFTYKLVLKGQIKVLIDRAYACTQTVVYSCLDAALHDSDLGDLVTWTTRDGNVVSYFDGLGGNSACFCGLTEPNSCDDDSFQCNCDIGDTTNRTDSGMLLNPDEIPMMSVDVNEVGGTAEFNVGPLICKDLYPNCAAQKHFRDSNKLANEENFEDGSYTIDPEGQGPFVVECQGTRTIVSVVIEPPGGTSNDKDEGISECFKVGYKSYFNDQWYEISPDQIQALVRLSNHCSQSLEVTCTNAPITGFTNYSTCDSVTQKGWSGSKGSDQCPCGILGTCKDGANCNCDVEDGKEAHDGGFMHDKQYLAVCEVCVGLDAISNLPANVTLRQRKSQPFVSDLICDWGQIGKTGSCQEWLNSGMRESGVQMIDADGAGPLEPFPFYCNITTYPPMGIELVKPKNPVHEIPSNGTTVTIQYWVYRMEIVRELIENSGYCTQEMTLICEDASLILDGEYGWYSVDGELQSYWAGNEAGTIDCTGGTGDCTCNLPGMQEDGGLIIDDSVLPISEISFPPSNGTRKLVVGDLKCFNLPKDCEEIRVKNLKKNPHRNNTYAIDTDGPGGLEPFAVVCDFTTDPHQGITVIPTIVPPESSHIKDSVEPGETVVNITYDSASYDQAHSLAQISGFCFQAIQYTCYKSPLLNFGEPAYSFLSTYGGQPSDNFGVADRTDVDGCACAATNSCPDGTECRCDALGPMTTVDYGYLTNLDLLPVEQFSLGGQTDPEASATLDVSNLRCAPRPFDLPKDCQEAYERNLKTGNILILPNPNVDPFLVFCDMDRGFGVAVVSNNLEGGEEVPTDTTVPVKYYSAIYEQLEGLAEESEFCYMPIKIDCQYSKITSSFHWKGGYNDEVKKSVGYGRTINQECNCGRDGQNGQCGGSEDKDYLLTHYRACNCDADDAKLRKDAGVYNSTTKLPIRQLTFEDITGTTGNPNATRKLTLGKLYCADFDFDIDECKMGFYDCDEHATCINKHGYYQCRCNPGYRGFGVKDKWSNGRDCHDDDECELNYCPDTSTCTNTPGSFSCKCNDGYEHTGPTSCKDINECAIGTHNCDENANCINLDGTFVCRCKRNYRGNGTYCSALAECSCFGDPHCLTSDGAIFHYQGECQYTMARDNCGNNLTGPPTYELLIKTAPRDDVEMAYDVTWVNYALFRYAGVEIAFRQGHEIWVDGVKQNLPYTDPSRRFHIVRFGNYVEVYTDIQVEVAWDGDDFIEIRTPGTFKGETCGFCGNYNDDPTDDLILGPACPGTGDQEDNFFVFGNSWVDLDYVADNPICAANCTPRGEPVCEGTDLLKAEQICKKIWDVNGHFSNCLHEMDENILRNIKTTCIYDVCAAGDGDATKPVCDSAQILYQECLNMQIPIDKLEDFCDENCKENMTVMLAGPVNQDTCMAYLNNSETEGETDPAFSEGCFCNEGYYMDGDACVLPEDCGCLYEGRYFKTGDEITLDDCRSRGICYENHTVIFDEIVCDENAECVKKDGRYGCHCKEGYYGDGVVCTEDSCDPNPCGENETCLRDSTKVSGYECECSMGFAGNCSNCFEIDECETGTADCPYHSVCINTVGSYKCHCLQGFYMLKGRCDDVNECDSEDKGASLCGNNSMCTNKIGTYNCPCCDGFEQDESGNCVETPGAEPGAKCCTCDIAKCEEPGEVCGEDFQQYDSIKDMIISNCEKNLSPSRWQQIDYFGKCKGSCDDVQCPEYQTCVYNEAMKAPTCECDSCSVADETSGEVCSKGYITYPSKCAFMHIMCGLDEQEELFPDTEPCDDKNGVGIVSPWSPWSPCSVTCGKGVQSKTRTATNEPLTDAQKEKYPLKVSKACYKDPCPDSSCIAIDCERNAAVCVENPQNQPKCECPDCENVDLEPVCGFVTNIVGGPRPVTWRSECELLAFVCHNNIDDFELMHEGHCGTVPEECTRVPDMKFLKGGPNNTYISVRRHTLNKCMGGCGPNKMECCQATKKSKKVIQLKDGLNTYNQEFEAIDKCECVDISEEEP